MMNEIKEWIYLSEKIESLDNPNILLGNGFNICLGVNTSYESLWDSIYGQQNVKDIMKDYSDFPEEVSGNGYNLEACLNKIKNAGHLSTLKKDLYTIILRRCRTKYKHEEVISFLSNFKNFFTINYDPLLYRFLLQSSKTSIKKDDFFRDIKTIHGGNISNIEICDKDISLREITKRQVYEIALKIFKDQEQYNDKKREEYYAVLKKIRKEKEIDINDGFVISQPNKKKRPEKTYKIWDFDGQENQNIYYIHGAMHIYKEGNQIRKIILKKGHHDKKFINEILDVKSKPSCVFEKNCKDKLNKIDNNEYLDFCLKSLRQTTGALIIIGWSCNENDNHLIDAINESNMSKLYISYCLEETKNRYVEKFSKKSLIFFKSNILPFAKKSPSSKTCHTDILK